MKWGLGDSYDNVEFLSKKTRAYLDITKPASTLGITIAFALASLFYFYYTGQQDMLGDRFFTIVYASVTVGFAHGASQSLNMAEDADMDRNTEHKQDRPIPAGIISEEEARSVAWILSALAIGRGYMVNWRFGVFITIALFMGIFYNLEPIRAKERSISIPWQATSRGLMMFPTVWAAYGDLFQPEPWILSTFMFFYVLGFQNTADIIDEEIDREYGVQTFIVMYGVKRTAVIALGCTLMMVSTIMLAIEFGYLPPEFQAMGIISVFCIIMVYYMLFYPYKVSPKTGNHPAWLWFYAGMVLCILIPLVIELNVM